MWLPHVGQTNIKATLYAARLINGVKLHVSPSRARAIKQLLDMNRYEIKWNENKIKIRQNIHIQIYDDERKSHT